MTNSITKIPEVIMQLLEWQVTVHLYLFRTVHTGVEKQSHTLPSH